MQIAQRALDTGCIVVLQGQVEIVEGGEHVVGCRRAIRVLVRKYGLRGLRDSERTAGGILNLLRRRSRQ